MISSLSLWETDDFSLSLWERVGVRVAYSSAALNTPPACA